MFLPLVTKSRLPTTCAPVVSPTSCLIEPRYWTLSDDTQSGPDLLACAAGAAASMTRTATSANRPTRIAPTDEDCTYPTARGKLATRRRTLKWQTHAQCSTPTPESSA